MCAEGVPSSFEKPAEAERVVDVEAGRVVDVDAAAGVVRVGAAARTAATCQEAHP